MSLVKQLDAQQQIGAHPEPRFDAHRHVGGHVALARREFGQLLGRHVQALGVLVIKRFESGSDPRASTVNAIERALVDAGVTLIDDGAASPAGAGAGVRLTRPAVGGGQ
jgi:hypothetical protein